jgi:Methane oxygenase PmoA
MPAAQVSSRIHQFILVAVCGLAVAAFCANARAQSPANSAFQFKDLNDKSLAVLESDKTVLVYNHGDIEFRQRNRTRKRAGYVHPIYGLDGEVLTDNHPSDHLHHHGLFWGWPHTKIGDRQYDFWNKEDIAIRFKKWLAKDAGPDGAKVGIENAWVVNDKEVAKEEIWLNIHPATADSRSIDVKLTWTPLEPISLEGAPGKSYGGLALRFAPRKDTVITVPTGRAKEDLLITQLPWADFTGQFKDAPAPSGAAIFIKPDHPDFPPEWMTRSYGMLAVGWPGVKSKTLEPGNPITCQYRIWIHRGNPEAPIIQSAYESYAQTP